ncbi:histidine phosphatase family protein [Anaerobacillus arseniciselenatis]|uniref:Histidine phosphatase family protein n=2 Tax=Anaerobacillus arseniciselenatis TaxID=85682 RepID=A0A1S2LVQ3_9BACI|nr:histidine phosphatase family protein [Anaerobacillus arseniciselenatis]
MFLNSLREGGYILFARHAEATIGRDLPNLSFYDCATQRNLSDRGRSQAFTYGEELRRLNIPVNYPVITSPFCRNIETAQLAFGEQNFQIDPFLVETYRLSGTLNAWEQASILNQLDAVLETQPSPGRNTVIIGHSLPRGVGFGRIPNMGTVIVRPFGQGNGYEIIARLSLPTLSNLDN